MPHAHMGRWQCSTLGACELFAAKVQGEGDGSCKHVSMCASAKPKAARSVAPWLRWSVDPRHGVCFSCLC